MLHYRTAGESHGNALLTLVEGLPAGLDLDVGAINAQLARRQRAPGRSKRQEIERDTVTILSGVRQGRTLGSPLAMMIQNRDATMESLPNPVVPRPGHADLAGILKFANRDIRGVLERASARETAARTAAGAVASQLLYQFGIIPFAYVTEIGGIAHPPAPAGADVAALRGASEFYSLHPDLDSAWRTAIETAGQEGDTLGGIVEIVVFQLPPGLGHYRSFRERLDGRLAGALMSIQAVKGVEIGLGFESARRRGSAVHDAIAHRDDAPFGGFVRPTNHAGGLEGGMTNGEPLVVRVAMKPIPTMKRGAPSVRLDTHDPEPATYQRSDVCAVPALSVVAESVVAFEVATALTEAFTGDSIDAMRANFDAWRAKLQSEHGGAGAITK